MVTRNRLRIETSDYLSEEIKKAQEIVLGLQDQEYFYKEKLAEVRKRLDEAKKLLREKKDNREILRFNNLSTNKEPVNPSGRKPSIFR